MNCLRESEVDKVNSFISLPFKSSLMPKKPISTASAATGSSSSNAPPGNSFQINVTKIFLIKAILGAALLAFAVGRLSVVIFLNAHSDTGVVMTKAGPSYAALPPIIFSPTKEVPHTVYSSKQFDTMSKVSTSDTLLARRAEPPTIEPEEKTEQKEVMVDGSLGNDSWDYYDGPRKEPEEEVVHAPAGQHLLIDIKSVNGVFLNSEEQLAQAMVDLIKMSGLTMLSYHCHGLPPVGVSCIGVLLESHISFHTWPIQGVITLDLFTCGPSGLLPLLPDIKRLFGVPRLPAHPGEYVEEPYMQWAHKDRGFRDLDGQKDRNPEDVDMAQFLLGWLEYSKKDVVALEKTDFQEIEIFEIINSRFESLESYKKSLEEDDSYYTQNRDLFRPDKIIYLDGVTQSRLMGEAAYHEALVHPAMVSHPRPKRVAIVGGGEGATLREVLKHNTVEHVTMVEIDEKMVNVCRKFLPEWSDCRNLVGSAPSCFDDPRAEIIYSDAITWFIERFGNKAEIDANQKFDVIIMDALDPESKSAFSDMLYLNDDFVDALTNAMTDEGVLVAQMGGVEGLEDPGAHVTDKGPERIFKESLFRRGGFETIETYEEAHGGFLLTWTFIIGFKDSFGNNWNLNQAGIDLALLDRAMETKNGSELPFRYFDGASMMGYQFPSRLRQEIFCRSEPTPLFCENGHGFDPERANIPVSAFEVKESAVPNAGRGLYTKVDIPEGSYLAIDESVNDMIVSPATTALIKELNDAKGFGKKWWQALETYMFAYGFESEIIGGPAYSVDPGIFTFMNHGCNGTHVTSFPNAPMIGTEMDADPLFQDPALFPKTFGEDYESNNLFVRRNMFEFMNSIDVARRDVKAGEEILDNYLTYYTEKNWEKGVTNLQLQCTTHAAGPVNQYESQQQKPSENSAVE